MTPVRVEIRIEGHLDLHWSTWFGGLTLAQEPDGTTTLRGDVADQARLYGVLAQVRDLGATLISLTTTPTAGPTPADRGGRPSAGAPIPGDPSSRDATTPPR